MRVKVKVIEMGSWRVKFREKMRVRFRVKVKSKSE